MYSLNEKSVNKFVLLIAAIQFLFVVDYMMLSPIGPVIANSMGFDYQYVGLVFSSFTFASVIGGLITHRFLDKYDRKVVILISLSLMSLFTVLCTLAVNLETLLVFRFMAGFASGPCAALLITVVIELVPEQNRGRALGTVMGAFGLGTVLGVPFSVFLSGLSDWTAPFLIAGVLGGVIVALMVRSFPSMRQHINGPHKKIGRSAYLNKRYWLGWGVTLLAVLSTALIVQVIGTLMTVNEGVSSNHLSLYYFISGVASIILAKLAGLGSDKWGARSTLISLSTLLTICIAVFLVEPLGLPTIVLFVLVMGLMSARGVAVQSFVSSIPKPEHRAFYMAIFNVFMNVGVTLAGLFLSVLVVEQPDGKVSGQEYVGLTSIVLSIVVIGIVLISTVSKRRGEEAIGAN